MPNNVDLSTGFGSRVNIAQDPDWWMNGYGASPSASPTFKSPGGAHSGNGPFGLVPGPIGDVSNIAYDDLLKRIPTLPGLNANAANGVMNRLSGNLSPETQAAIQDTAARFGVSSGMPGAQLSRFRTARDLGRTTEDIQRAGLQDYGTLLNAARAQNVSPETQIGAKEQDLINAAAPDPAAQASYAKQLFDQYLNSLSRGGRNPSGGSGGGNDFQRLLETIKGRSPSGGTGTPTPNSGDMSFDDYWDSSGWDLTQDGWSPHQGSGSTSSSTGGGAMTANIPPGDLPDWLYPDYQPTPEAPTIWDQDLNPPNQVLFGNEFQNTNPVLWDWWNQPIED